MNEWIKKWLILVSRRNTNITWNCIIEPMSRSSKFTGHMLFIVQNKHSTVPVVEIVNMQLKFQLNVSENAQELALLGHSQLLFNIRKQEH